jgi:hypothetical protein
MAKKTGGSSSNVSLILACVVGSLVGPLLNVCYEPAKSLIQERWQKLDSTPHVESTPEDVVQVVPVDQTVPSVPVCYGAGYTPRILMYNDPFVMHIENFITAEERAYLLELG